MEVACELPARLRAVADSCDGSGIVDPVRVILADRGPQIARGLGGGQPVIERACRELGIELMTDFDLASVDSNGATLVDGRRIEASTVIWCAGLRANELTHCAEASHDSQGRLNVDEYMRVPGIDHLSCAADVANALIDGERPSVMSCQHARPMGRFAGHNAVNELFGLPMQPLCIDWYTNIVDLGPWGAVYTQGWDREVVAEVEQAKNTKSVINRQRIYPPRQGGREQILAAANLDLQRPPQLKPMATTGLVMLRNAPLRSARSGPMKNQTSGSRPCPTAPLESVTVRMSRFHQFEAIPFFVPKEPPCLVQIGLKYPRARRKP